MKRAMRDAFIEELALRMRDDDSIFFLTADLGAPALDQLKADFPDRFTNLGIAEQNLINVATGLALENRKVYAYAIAPFVTMRAFEQIRNLALLSQIRPINVNIIGIGAGMSYVTSGPQHHALEDISIIRTLPNIVLFSPSDLGLTREFVDYSLNNKCPKYIRLDGEPVGYLNDEAIISEGLREIITGKDSCIVATGHMVHTAIEASKKLSNVGYEVGVIDLFMLKMTPTLKRDLTEFLRGYMQVFTLEEGFLGAGGVDSVVMGLSNDDNEGPLQVISMGLRDRYAFEVGNRTFLHNRAGIDVDGVVDTVVRNLS